MSSGYYDNLQYGEFDTPGAGSSSDPGTTTAILPLPPANAELPSEPLTFTEEEVGGYKETDRYLPVRTLTAVAPLATPH